jgi:hypothetical protein
MIVMADRPIRRLAILVVYLVRNDDELALLALHLDRIRRHTSIPYTLYASTNRATPAADAAVRAAPNVVICDVEPTEERGSREHAYYLDAMMARARADGATHIVTFDVDSFPIDDRWVDVLAAAMPDESGVAAILRVENGDSALPHPSCTMLRHDFLDRYEPSFSPDSDLTPEFRRFLRATQQAGDTGIRIGHTLNSEGLPWGKLLRTNTVDVHYLMAGLYADVVFHLGAGARATLFRKDLERSRVHRWTKPIERVRTHRESTRRFKHRVLAMARARAEGRFIAANEEVAAQIRAWLLDDPDGLFAYLRGGAGRGASPDRRS